MKIGSHLTKLSPIMQCPVFYEPQCRNTTLTFVVRLILLNLVTASCVLITFKCCEFEKKV